MCVCMCALTCTHLCGVPGARVIGSYELPKAGDRNQTHMHGRAASVNH